MHGIGAAGERIRVIEYRSFHNADPPALVDLWHESGLGRGAADDFSYDAFELVNFSQPYFDADGLIVAHEGERIVGFSHAGFGVNADKSGLDYTNGVVCMVLVDRDYRRHGVGRELVSRAENYLRSKGATSIFAGPSESRDPFYFGVYGGSQPSGFLDSDPGAAPFFQSLGYAPVEHHGVYQRDIVDARDPVSFRLVTVRRKFELSITDRPRRMTWWWATRYGRLDPVRFMLVPKGGGEPHAAITALPLDLYLNKWQERAWGLCELFVAEEARRQGYGQALLLEVCRRLRDELVTRVEAHAPEDNAPIIGLLQTCGFQRIDTGTVYRKS